MTQTYKKKLIEVAIPLEAINVASQHEKAIRQGHPSSLHQWWARRPLAACRAVLFAQLVDDPSSNPDRFPTEQSQKVERDRLFNIIEQLVKWENTSNKDLLEAAHSEIVNSCGPVLPAIYDPFSGASSIPLEAQRLGLPSYGSDLNPVAVLIGKALVEIPSLFNNRTAVNPAISKDKLKSSLWLGRGAQGLAADLRYYGDRVREHSEQALSKYFQVVQDRKGFKDRKPTIISWIWARTVRTPNPAFGGADTACKVLSNLDEEGSRALGSA